MSDRYDLEEAIGEMAQTANDIKTIIYAIGDSPHKHTEDELLNMLIGIEQLHKTRYDKMWFIFEELIKNGTLSNKSVSSFGMPSYDDGTMKMEVSDSEGSVK
jgi:hypothetical protein